MHRSGPDLEVSILTSIIRKASRAYREIVTGRDHCKANVVGGSELDGGLNIFDVLGSQLVVGTEDASSKCLRSGFDVRQGLLPFSIHWPVSV